MDAIYLALFETQIPDARDALIKEMLGFMGIENREFLLRRDTNGKPRLTVLDGSFVGYAQSHARGSQPMTSLIAMVKGREIGVDVEIWPLQSAGPDFLKTVSCTEDRAALKLLGKSGRDAAIALWVIKEAALKCTGEVMTDPLDLAVSIVSPDLFRIENSDCASSPHPQIDVRLFELTSGQMAGGITLLVGIALAGDAHTIMKKRREIHFMAENWVLAEVR